MCQIVLGHPVRQVRGEEEPLIAAVGLQDGHGRTLSRPGRKRLPKLLELLRSQQLGRSERRPGSAAKSDRLLEAAAASELGSFITGLRQDEEAVRAALAEPWSNGHVEGQVNRLKLIKRSMYGRAKFDLLRQRVLHAA